jgi:hypothetical protein
MMMVTVMEMMMLHQQSFSTFWRNPSRTAPYQTRRRCLLLLLLLLLLQPTTDVAATAATCPQKLFLRALRASAATPPHE